MSLTLCPLVIYPLNIEERGAMLPKHKPRIDLVTRRPCDRIDVLLVNEPQVVPSIWSAVSGAKGRVESAGADSF